MAIIVNSISDSGGNEPINIVNGTINEYYGTENIEPNTFVQKSFNDSNVVLTKKYNATRNNGLSGGTSLETFNKVADDLIANLHTDYVYQALALYKINSDGTITWGTTLRHNKSTHSGGVTFPLGSNRLWTLDNLNNKYLLSIIYSYSGTTLTKVAENSISITTKPKSIVKFEIDRISSGSNYFLLSEAEYVYLLNLSGNTGSFIAREYGSSLGSGFPSTKRIADNKFLRIWDYNNVLKAEIITTSTTSITIGSSVNLNSSVSKILDSIVLPNGQIFVSAQNTSGKLVMFILNVSGTTISVAYTKTIAEISSSYKIGAGKLALYNNRYIMMAFSNGYANNLGYFGVAKIDIKNSYNVELIYQSNDQVYDPSTPGMIWMNEVMNNNTKLVTVYHTTLGATSTSTNGNLKYANVIDMGKFDYTVKPSTGTIDGVTKTACSATQKGQVYTI